ncbi:uncharacterized protein VTP21DRAFT_9717 [Calcarisporiella thermophila]|uniref:uncharacterized protein n=1 Tax=Calcarisporiella thermophila TaxID=911321 RepID=UPI0037442F80
MNPLISLLLVLALFNITVKRHVLILARTAKKQLANSPIATLLCAIAFALEIELIPISMLLDYLLHLKPKYTN